MSSQTLLNNRAIIAVSGIQAAGKTTVSSLLARRFEKGVHIEADVLQKFIVSGGVWPDKNLEDEAMRQLRLRGRNAALLADSFFEEGFTPVIDDIFIGSRFAELYSDVKNRPLLFVMLLPSLDAVRKRTEERSKRTDFDEWKHLHEIALNETPKAGLWLDTSRQKPEQTVDEIIERAWDEARVD